MLRILSKRIILLLFIAFGVTLQGWALPITGDYQSNGTVDLQSSINWQTWDGSNWISALAAPNGNVSSGNTITVLPGHTWNNAGPSPTIPLGVIVIHQGTTGTFSTAAGNKINLSGTYVHNTTSGIVSVMDGMNILSGSTIIYRGGSTLNPSRSFSGRTYYNLSFESISGALSTTLGTSGSSALTVNGTLDIGINVSLSQGGFTGTLNFNGNINISGTLNVNSFTVATSKLLTMNAAGTLTVPTSQTLSVNGILNCNARIISGAGNFSLADDATLKIGSVSGIETSIGAGNIQVTGSRTFSPAANYEYNGIANQVTGTALSTAKNLTIAGTGAVTLSQSITVTNDLTLTTGALDVKQFFDYTITIGGNWINNNLAQASAFLHRNGVVIFNGNNLLQTISGRPTNFYDVTVNKGTSNTNILEVLSGFLMDGNLTLINGTFKMSVANHIFPFAPGTTTIGATQGFWNNGGNIGGSAGLLIVEGLLKQTAGSLFIGDNITLQGTNVDFEVTGGLLSIGGWFDESNAGGASTVNITGGSINVSASSTQVNSATNSIFRVPSNSNFNFSDGTIIIHNANLNTTLPDLNISNPSVGISRSITGGTFKIGHGSGTQGNITVSLGNSIIVPNLTVDAPAKTPTLSSDVNVGGVINLMNGIVITGSNTLTNTGSITGGSATSYISGKLARAFTAPGSKIFPVGKGGNFRPLELLLNAGSDLATITAEQIEPGEESFAGQIPPGASLLADRFWRIHPSAAGNYNYDLTLDGTDGVTTTVKMLKYNSPSTTDIFTTTSPATNNYKASGITSFSDFALVECVAPSQPADFTTSSSLVCQGQTNVTYTVPNDPSAISYTWSYSGTNATFSSTTNTVSVDFGSSATSGTLSVVANGCDASTARSIAIMVQSNSDAPVVGTPICPGSTLVRGSSTEAEGTLITVFINGLPAGTTTVSSTQGWVKTVPALSEADQVSATAQAVGECTSGELPSVTVWGQSDVPVITTPICAGATTISGTSTEPDGSTIIVYRTGLRMPNIFTTVTANAWSITLPAVTAGMQISASAQDLAGEECVSGFATTTVQNYSVAPVVSAVCDGSTSVNGTSAESNGAVIEVFKGTTSLGTTTVTAGAWTKILVNALSAGDVITATAKYFDECTSAASPPVAVTAKPIPTFTNSPSSPQCTGTNITYTTQASQYNYFWSIPGVDGTDYTITGGGITGNTVTLKWLIPGSKTVTVNYASSDGCTGLNPASSTIMVNARPIPTFTVSPVSPQCSNIEVTYTTQISQNAYLWNISGIAGADYTITGGGITGNAMTLKWITPGSKSVTVNYTNSDGCTGLNPASSVITVNGAPVFTLPSSTILPTVQYSDLVNTAITVSDDGSGSSLDTLNTYWKLSSSSTWIRGFPTTLSLIAGTITANSKSWTIYGNVNVPAGEYKLKITVTDGDCQNSEIYTLNVTEEDAIVDYSGNTYFSTLSSTNNNYVVTMAGVAKDIEDAYRGKIVGNALMDFRTGNTTSSPVAFNSAGALGRTIGQTIPGDDRQGMATTTQINGVLSSSEISNSGKVITVYVMTNKLLNGNSFYKGVSAPAVVTVAIPGQDNVTGGGQLSAANPSGLYADANYRKLNFGFTMKWNKSGKNLVGQVNIIFRTAGGINCQVKSNAVNSLVVQDIKDGTKVIARKAIFNTKANLTNLDNPLNPGLGGNLNLTVEAQESLVAGGSHQFTVTLTNPGGGLLYASNWNGKASLMQPLTNGNISIRGSTTPVVTAARLGAGKITDLQEAITGVMKNNPSAGNEKLSVQVMPNPSSNYFTFLLHSSNHDDVRIRVIEATGKVIEKKYNVPSNGILRLGARYTPGIYIAEITQGNYKVTLRLVKQ